MSATSHRRPGTFAEPRLTIPTHLSGADEVSCTVTPLYGDDTVLVRVDSGYLSIELPLPSIAALDLSLRLCACVVRLRRDSTAD